MSQKTVTISSTDASVVYATFDQVDQACIDEQTMTIDPLTQELHITLATGEVVTVPPPDETHR